MGKRKKLAMPPVRAEKKRKTDLIEQVCVTNKAGELVDLEDVLEYGPYSLTGILSSEKDEQEPLFDESIVLGYSIKISPVWTYNLKDVPEKETMSIWIVTPQRRYGILSPSSEYKAIYEQISEKNRLFYLIKTKFKDDMISGTLEDYDNYIEVLKEKLELPSCFQAILLVQKHIRFLLTQMVATSSLHVWSESPFFIRIRSSYEHLILQINKNIYNARQERKKSKLSSNNPSDNNTTMKSSLNQALTLINLPEQPFSISSPTATPQLGVVKRTSPLRFPLNDIWLSGLRIVDPNIESISLWKRIQVSTSPKHQRYISLQEVCSVIAQQLQITNLEALNKLSSHGETLLQIMHTAFTWRGTKLFNDIKHAIGFRSSVQQARSQFRGYCYDYLFMHCNNGEKTSLHLLRTLICMKLDFSNAQLAAKILFHFLLFDIGSGLSGSDYTYEQYINHSAVAFSFTEEIFEKNFVTVLPDFVKLFSISFGYWPAFSFYDELLKLLRNKYPKVYSSTPNLCDQVWLDRTNLFPCNRSTRSTLPYRPTKLLDLASASSCLSKKETDFKQDTGLYSYNLEKVEALKVSPDLQTGIWSCPVQNCLYFAVCDNPYKPSQVIYDHLLGHVDSKFIFKTPSNSVRSFTNKLEHIMYNIN